MTASVTSRPGKLSWSVTRGYDAVLTLTFVDDAGAAIDLSAGSFTAAVLDRLDASAATITVDDTDAATGVLVLSIVNTDTADLTSLGYRWYLTENVSSALTPLLDGPLPVASIGESGLGSGSASATVTITTASATVTCTAATAQALSGGGGGGGGAPTDATYLTTTSNATLSAEVVVGATPGGELGGTWASPTVDATHSGSSHASVQAAAEATAASALSTHAADTTSVHGIADTSALATSTDVSTAVSNHVAATDPHGDRAYADGLFAANDALVYKGAIDCSSNPNYPAASAGHLYKVSVAGKIGGASGTNVEVGDSLLCTVDNSSAGTQAAVGANWDIIQTNIDGAVVGPASSTSGNLPTFNGTGGKLLQDSGTALSSLAPKASPALTGTPTAPTPTAADNSTKIATTAYVDTADNLKAPLASPTFTGTPAAPTAAQATNTTQLATTAFVESESVLKYGGGKETVNTQSTATGAVTLNLANGNVFDLTLTGNITLTFSGSTASVACSMTLIARQDATGSRTITWPAAVKWAGGTAPTISTGASKVDTFTFFTVDNGTTWYGYASGIDMR